MIEGSALAKRLPVIAIWHHYNRKRRLSSTGRVLARLARREDKCVGHPLPTKEHPSRLVVGRRRGRRATAKAAVGMIGLQSIESSLCHGRAAFESTYVLRRILPTYYRN